MCALRHHGSRQRGAGAACGAGPLCRDTSRGIQPAQSAELPAGTVSVAVLQGSLPRGARSVNACRFRVNTGARRIMVYKGADTRIDKVTLLSSGVRVVAARHPRTGVLVAERIVGRANARNEVERAFLATVDVVDRGLTDRTTQEVGGTGRQYLFDVTAAEDESLGATRVAIEFDTVAPVPELAAPPAP
ncbi:MAG TPA: hypothetical protein VNP20_11130 [Nocardioidaceae bacterium]|nr:hypothetical protein [Nocardioidaceae bacterium]